MNTSTGMDPACAHCGRPVLGEGVYGNAGVYHFECVRGPGYPMQFSILFDSVAINKKIDSIEARLKKLENNASSATGTRDAGQTKDL